MKYSDEQNLTSKETKVLLKIQDCELAHIRNAGKIKFIKKGNAFLYLKKSVEAYKNTWKKVRFNPFNQEPFLYFLIKIFNKAYIIFV